MTWREVRYLIVHGLINWGRGNAFVPRVRARIVPWWQEGKIICLIFRGPEKSRKAAGVDSGSKTPPIRDFRAQLYPFKQRPQARGPGTPPPRFAPNQARWFQRRSEYPPALVTPPRANRWRGFRRGELFRHWAAGVEMTPTCRKTERRWPIPFFHRNPGLSGGEMVS
jgi:hypothetical protein